MEYYLRDAVEADAELLFRWANDPEVRKNSFSTQMITWEEHRRWYAGVLEDPGVRQYIFVCGEREVGQIRIKLSNTDMQAGSAAACSAEIGYSIAAEYRGKGYAKRMMACLKEKVREEFPEVVCLVARVKPENNASRKVFEDCGYREKCSVYELPL